MERRVHERPAAGVVTNHISERGNSIEDSVMESARAAVAFILIHHLLTWRKKRKPRWWSKKLYTAREQYGCSLLTEITCVRDV